MPSAMPRKSERIPRDDERRNLEAGDEQGVERAACRTDDYRRDRGDRNGKTEILCAAPNTTATRPSMAPTDRSMPPPDDYRRAAPRPAAELHAEPGDFEEVADGEKVRRNDGIERDLREDSEDATRYSPSEQARQCRSLVQRRHQARAPAPAQARVSGRSIPPMRRSPTAARTIAPAGRAPRTRSRRET